MKVYVMNYVLFFCFIVMTAFSCPGWTTHGQEESPWVDKTPSQHKASEETTIWGITEDQLDQLFGNSSDYVALVSELRFHRVNKRWTDILGWTAEELTSKPFVEFIHPEDTHSTKDAVHKGSHIACVINFENRYRTTEGEYHLIQWFGLRQVSGLDRRTPILAIGKDLTLERKAKEQKYALRQAEAANCLKSAFVAHMSHEIRTPLNGVLGFLDLALEEKVSESVRSHLQNAKESSHFLLDVANDIIDVSKIEAGTLKIEQRNFNPLTAIKNALSLLTLQAQKKNLSLKSWVDPHLPPLLQGDENRLKQILFNLLGNAIKFTSRGGVSLKIEGQTQAESPSTFLLRGRIKDTGMGIDPQFMSRLFQPFSQEDHSMRRQFGGAGLGLYITKQLCEKMGGTINAISTPGIGTTFQFHLLCHKPLLSTSDPYLKPNTLSASSLEHFSLSKVLVVEDNLMNQKVITLLLKKMGYEVDIAEDGQQGVEAIQKKTYDLVLMDIEMPVMDGVEATRRIRQQFSAKQLPIIGVSAHAMSTHREQFLGVGMNGYLAKPIHKDILSQEILKCFQELSQSTLS